MLVHRFLEDSARATPEAAAVIELRRSVTYAELDRLANRVAQVLLEAGVQPGDRVVLAADNCVELVAAYFGTMKAGATAVPLPAGPKSDRLSRAVLDCTPKACVVDAATAAAAVDGHPLADVPALLVIDKPGAARPSRGIPLSEKLAVASEADAGIRRIDRDLAAIIYTSGSTGEPRGVMLTHRNIVTNTRSITEYLRLSSRDRVMCVLPFYYVYGLSLLHTHVAVGGSVVIDNRFVFPNVVLRAMQEHHVTGFAGVPSTFALLLHRSDLVSLPLPDLRYVTQAGGGMPVSRILEWLDRGPKVPFYVMYGATEASARLTYLDPADLLRKLGSIGRPIPNVEILVLRDDETRASAGEVGELVARGSNISPGYWNAAEESARRFCAEGYRTGDLGYVDDDGYLFLVGRKHDMIKVGAHRVGAKEIEDILSGHPNVHEAAVIAGSHEILGEVPVAFVSLTAPLEQASQALEVFCRMHLPSHKVPASFYILSDIPKMVGIGKIDKAALRNLARTSQASQEPTLRGSSC